MSKENYDKSMHKIRTGVILFIILVIPDQLSKLWALSDLRLRGPIPVIPGILELTYTENRGAAFGMLQNRQWFFMVITLLVLAGILLIICRLPQERRFFPLFVILIVLSAGAFGNLIDRVFRHYVVDFIYFKPINFPVFNVADIYVTVSAFLLVFMLAFIYSDEDLNRVLKGDKKDRG